MNAYSLPTTNQLLNEIAASYIREEFDPETMITVRQFCELTGIKDSRARAIMREDPRLEQVEVRINGRPVTAYRRRQGESITDSPA